MNNAFLPPQKIVLEFEANVVLFNLKKWEIENSLNFVHVFKQEE